jgi:protein SCO1
MPPEPFGDRHTPEEDVAALVDAVRQDPGRRDRLVALLPERIELYAGRSTNATVRMRGYLLAAFEQVGLPEAALPYVLEELESGRDAYLVAAAAMAIRGLDRPTSQLIPFLRKAEENIATADDAVSFDSYRPHWPAPGHTTATREIARTLAWLDGQAEAVPSVVEGCCSPDPAGPGAPAHDGCSETAVPVGVPLEDQDGQTLRFGDYFTGQPSAVTFFYTRCDNPNKCSLTITKLAELQRALGAEGLRGRVRTAAITYDPAYDLPARLRAFGENRGVTFGKRDRFFRTRARFEDLAAYFGLEVNFGQALVNRHRIELFVLDQEADVAAEFTRLQWRVPEVLAAIRILSGH